LIRRFSLAKITVRLDDKKEAKANK